MLKVCIVHNHYQYAGGEDQVFAEESRLLEENGHPVVRYTVHNDEVDQMSTPELARTTLWSKRAHDELRHLLRRERPDVVHFHNTLPLISPSAYYAAHKEGVATAQTLHNYRLVCPGGLLFRDGRVCEDCLGRRVPWPGVAHACYRDSRAATGAVASMLSTHRMLGTWTQQVHRYIALTAFARQKFVAGGLPEDRMSVKPNFISPDPGLGDGTGEFALFVGRLTPEKGIATLLDAWAMLHAPMPLRIIGEGPMEDIVAQKVEALPNVEWLGRKPRAFVLSSMKQAAVLIFPSTWYEGLPMTIVEAYATGLPVVASNLGASSSLVEHERTGLHVAPGDPADLAEKVRWIQTHPEAVRRMRQHARAAYEQTYTAEQNYAMLVDIYRQAIQEADAASR